MKLKFLGYFLFIAGCFIVSLYAQFPGKMAAKYIEQTFSQINSQIKIEIDNVTPSFPPGMKIESILINYADTPIARLENFKSFFKLFTLFSDTVTGSFKADVFNGIISGIVRVSKEKPREIGIETDLGNLNLKNIHMGKSLSDGRFSGILNGKVTVDFKQGHIRKNYGELKFMDLILQFPEALFAVETYSFSSGNIKFFMPKQNIIKIEDCILKGRQIDVQTSGEIKVAREFQKSILNFKARIVLYPMFFMNAGDSVPVDISKNESDNAIISLKIGGTIQNPTITMTQGTK